MSSLFFFSLLFLSYEPIKHHHAGATPSQRSSKRSRTFAASYSSLLCENPFHRFSLTIGAQRRISFRKAEHGKSSIIELTSYKPTTMDSDIAGLLAEAITKYRNAMPLPNTPGTASFHRIDVTTFLHKYESLDHFTGTDPSNKDVISMFPYYCAEGSDV
ncbi:hypothetical protein K440DRAFT_646563 [Wilcoxina mikolae CBS 423.85]|nr:hypothetical protein K440DRAFT_646563 [Wilcoxina mikolae CBS 423.85]